MEFQGRGQTSQFEAILAQLPTILEADTLETYSYDSLFTYPKEHYGSNPVFNPNNQWPQFQENELTFFPGVEKLIQDGPQEIENQAVRDDIPTREIQLKRTVEQLEERTKRLEIAFECLRKGRVFPQR